MDILGELCSLLCPVIREYIKKIPRDVRGVLFLFQILPDLAGGGVFDGDTGDFELGTEFIGGSPIFVGAGRGAVSEDSFLLVGNIRGGAEEIQAKEIVEEFPVAKRHWLAVDNGAGGGRSESI